MMKPLLFLSAALLLGSCATVQQNIDARTYLARCQFEYAAVKVTGVTFSSGLGIDAVDLETSVKITDTTDRDVALDHAAFSFFLDKNPVLDVAHQKFTRIAAKASVIEPLAVRLPFSGIVKALGHRPETLGIKAKLWLTVLLGKDTWETPIVVPVEVEVPVPYDQIDAFVAAKKKQLDDEAAAAARDAAKKAAEAAQQALPPAPSLKF